MCFKPSRLLGTVHPSAKHVLHILDWSALLAEMTIKPVSLHCVNHTVSWPHYEVNHNATATSALAQIYLAHAALSDGAGAGVKNDAGVGAGVGAPIPSTGQLQLKRLGGVIRT